MAARKPAGRQKSSSSPKSKMTAAGQPKATPKSIIRTRRAKTLESQRLLASSAQPVRESTPIGTTTATEVPQTPRSGKGPRRRRNPNTPPRPPNAWILYRTDRLKELQRADKVNGDSFLDLIRFAGSTSNNGDSSSGQSFESHSNGRLAEVSKLVSMMWKGESDNVRGLYAKMAHARKIQHQIEFPDYKYKPRRKNVLDNAAEAEPEPQDPLTSNNSADVFEYEIDQISREVAPKETTEGLSIEGGANECGDNTRSVNETSSTAGTASVEAASKRSRKRKSNEQVTSVKEGGAEEKSTKRKPSTTKSRATVAKSETIKRRAPPTKRPKVEMEMLPGHAENIARETGREEASWRFDPFNPFVPPAQPLLIDEPIPSSSFAMSPLPNFHFASPKSQQPHTDAVSGFRHPAQQQNEMCGPQCRCGASSSLPMYPEMPFAASVAMPSGAHDMHILGGVPQQQGQQQQFTGSLPDFQTPHLCDEQWTPRSSAMTLSSSAMSSDQHFSYHQIFPHQPHSGSSHLSFSGATMVDGMTSSGVMHRASYVDDGESALAFAHGYHLGSAGSGGHMVDDHHDFASPTLSKAVRSSLRVVTNLPVGPPIATPFETCNGGVTVADATLRYHYEPLFTPGLRLSFFPQSGSSVEEGVTSEQHLTTNVYCPSSASEQASTMDSSSPLVATPEDTFQLPILYTLATDAGEQQQTSTV